MTTVEETSSRRHGRRARALDEDSAQPRLTGDLAFFARRASVTPPPADSPLPECPRFNLTHVALLDDSAVPAAELAPSAADQPSQVAEPAELEQANGSSTEVAPAPVKDAEEAPNDFPNSDRGAKKSSWLGGLFGRGKKDDGSVADARDERSDHDTGAATGVALAGGVAAGGVGAAALAHRDDEQAPSGAPEDVATTEEGATPSESAGSANDVAESPENELTDLEGTPADDAAYLDESAEANAVEGNTVGEAAEPSAADEEPEAPASDASDAELAAAGATAGAVAAGVAGMVGDRTAETSQDSPAEVWTEEPSVPDAAASPEHDDADTNAREDADEEPVRADLSAFGPAEHRTSGDADDWYEVGDLPADQAPDPKPAPRFEGQVLNRPSRSATGLGGWVTWLLVALVLILVIVLFVTGLIGPGVLKSMPATTPNSLLLTGGLIS